MKKKKGQTGEAAEPVGALYQALEDNVTVPCPATVVGEPVTMIRFSYDGNTRRGITAEVRRPDGSQYVLSAADVLLKDTSADRYVDAYRQWLNAGVPLAAAASLEPIEVA
ncbi:MAG: hypothetical protein IT162_22620, partial [Bryobacterales bacterium]|nr:hypothetical protein [Bryobacterales bacterium]